jgi:lariat debranching enzyme
MMSHDWPLGIEQHGNVTDLIRKKPHFRAEIERNDLGSLPNRQILDTIRPKHWFSAHLHVKFQATVRHNVHTGDTTGISDPCTKSTPAAAVLVPSQIKSQPKPQGQKIEDDNAESPSKSAAKGENELHRCSQSTMDEEETTEFHGLETSSGRCGDTGIGDLTDQMTRFLALDKCLPRRHYLSILRLPAQGRNTQPSLTEPNGRDNDGDDDKTNATSEQQHQHRLHYDPEWLAILRKTHDLIVTDRRRVQVPEEMHPLTQDEIDEVVLRFHTDISDPAREEKDPGDSVDDDPLQIPFDFIRTVPVYSDPVFHNNCDPPPLPAMGNPHTDRLLHILGLDHKLTIPYDADLTPSIVSEQLNMASRRTRHPPPPPPPAPGSLDVDVNEIDLDCIGDDENVHDPSVVENENRCSNDDEDAIDIDNVDEEDDHDDEGNKHNYSDGDTKQRVEAEPTTDAPSSFSTKRPRVGE